MEIEIPKLYKNKFGVVVKTIYKEQKPLNAKEEILYFTVRNNSISFELYPKSPIVEIDKDMAITILKKIADFK
jgi:hypothetical protein